MFGVTNSKSSSRTRKWLRLEFTEHELKTEVNSLSGINVSQ